MTFDERLEEIFSTFWNEQSQNIFKAKNHEQLEKMQRESLSEAKTAIKQAIKELIPNKPKQVSKERMPRMETVTQFVAGGVRQTTVQDQDHTWSEQDLEDAAFECAKPYLDEIEKGFGL